MTIGYRYCGLALASDWPLPSLPLADWPGAAPNSASDPEPDLEIVLGSVPRLLPDEQRRTATFAHNGREALWWLDGIGRCLITAGGRQIRAEPAPDGDADGLGLLLLHPLMALAAVRRGDWMLNAAAVARNGQVFAFIGP